MQWARGSQAVGHKDIRRQRGSGHKRAGTCARGRSGPRGSNRRPVNIIIAERARAKGNGGSPPLHSKTAPYHSCLHTGKQHTGDGCAFAASSPDGKGASQIAGALAARTSRSRARCKPLTCSAYLPFPRDHGRLLLNAISREIAGLGVKSCGRGCYFVRFGFCEIQEEHALLSNTRAYTVPWERDHAQQRSYWMWRGCFRNTPLRSHRALGESLHADSWDLTVLSEISQLKSHAHRARSHS